MRIPSFTSIIWIGMIAGTLDIVAAIVVYGYVLADVPAMAILQSVASGIYGKAAFGGGWGMAVQGLLFHYLIAIIFTGIYFALYRYLAFLQKHAIVSGLLYGMLIWLVMNLLVLPLSEVTPRAFNLKAMLQGMVILMICVGLPIGKGVAWAYRKADNRAG